MLRSFILIIVAVLTQVGCCCCVPFQRVQENVRQAQKQIEDDQKRLQQIDDAKRKDEMQQLVAKNLGPNNFGGTLAPGSPFWNNLKQGISQRNYVTNQQMGGDQNQKPFSDVHPDGGVLIGFFAAVDDSGRVISYLQPIFLTSKGEKAGQAFGKPFGPVQVLKAKPGYAVGGATVRIGAIMDAITVTFMRVQGDRLNPNDRYDSFQVGGDGGGPNTFTSNGGLLVGIHGRQNENDNFSPAGSPVTLGFYSLP